MSLVYAIEDDSALRSELARILEPQGFVALSCEDFSVNLSSDAAAAILARAALAASPDCILLDLRLPGTVAARQEIMCDLWESDAFIDDNTLTVNVNRLRKTLSAIDVPDGFLMTRRGIGYEVNP